MLRIRLPKKRGAEGSEFAIALAEVGEVKALKTLLKTTYSSLLDNVPEADLHLFQGAEQELADTIAIKAPAQGGDLIFRSCGRLVQNQRGSR